MAATNSRRRAVTGRTWIRRGIFAVVVGASLGAGVGVAGVMRFEPGRSGQSDSLTLMLDSVRDQRAIDDANIQRREAERAAAAAREQQVNDSIALANDPNAPVVPDVVLMEEGVARAAIEAAGLTIGAIIFRGDSAAMGTVIGTTPSVGTKVRAGTAIELLLSDGRPPSSPLHF
jgi:PASTA domain